MPKLTADGLRAVTDIAGRHGVGVDAAVALTGALVAGQGGQAQFNHPDLGGMGQWSQGGMIMVGDMFDHGLKARIAALCNDLAALVQAQPSVVVAAPQSQTQGLGDGASLFAEGAGSGNWWPADLGKPGSAGAQNDMRYAFFPGARRLAIQQDGRISVYDTGDHRLSGFSQQQGVDRSLTFTSQSGLVRVADLSMVGASREPRQEAAASVADHEPARTPHMQPPQAAPPHATTTSAASGNSTSGTPRPTDEILKTIERLGELREKGVLTDEEFAAKKGELLSRL